jgi:hypothetical protein
MPTGAVSRHSASLNQDIVRLETPQAAVVAHDIDLESWALWLLGLLARHASRSGGGGDLSVRAQLLAVNVDNAPLIWQSPKARLSTPAM